MTPVAAQQVSLVVSPPRIDLEGKPGDILQKTIKITNNSESQELSLQAETANFIVEDNQGTPIKVTESASGRYLASPWFTLERSAFILGPKETTQLVVLINIPVDALPGGHYAGVFFKPVPAKGLKETVSYTATEIGSLFGITIAGDLEYDALIKNFSVKTVVSEFGPIDFSADIENQSDTHIRPRATITIHDLVGRKLADIPMDEVNIFPFTSRTLHGTWDNVWGFGRYTAALTVSYGPGLVTTRVLYFWIVPYRLIATVIIVFLVLLVCSILIRRHLKHLGDHRDDEIDELKRKIIELENHQH
ncbi:MAG: hypothetical protein ABII21_03700 [bacterium]